MSDPQIAFKPLRTEDFPLLTTWLNEPHLSTYRSHSGKWTLDDVQEKYATYVEGYKLVDGKQNPIHAYLIMINNSPIGYIQNFSMRDFPADELTALPANCAGLDLLIGDPNYIGKKLSKPILRQFLTTFVWPSYDACMVDPDTANLHAIRAFTNAGFKIIHQTTTTTFMITYKS